MRLTNTTSGLVLLLATALWGGLLWATLTEGSDFLKVILALGIVTAACSLSINYTKRGSDVRNTVTAATLALLLAPNLIGLGLGVVGPLTASALATYAVGAFLGVYLYSEVRRVHRGRSQHV